MNPSPVALFVYNRPDHTRRTVEALAANLRARQTPLFIFSDGPKSDAAREQVEAVRAYVRSLPMAGLFKSVEIHEAARNLGLKASIIAGATEVMNRHGRAIVLEDDLVTAPDFIAFMSDCLDYYEGDRTIGSVAGYSPLKAAPAGYPHSVYAVPRSSSHGWATWADRWRAVDWEARRFPEFWRSRRMRAGFDAAGADRSDRLRREVERGAQSWSVLFGFSLFLNGQNTIVPTITRVRNIGEDGSGVHSFKGAKLNDALPTEPVPYVLGPVEPDPRVLAAFRRVNAGPWRSRVARWLRSNGFAWMERTLRPGLGRRGL